MIKRIQGVIRDWIARGAAIVTAGIAAAAEAKEAKERATIAKCFNDRYTHRIAYDLKAPVGQSRAWMCPTCNRVHASIEFSFLSGMQYPACCGYWQGHRHFEGIAH